MKRWNCSQVTIVRVLKVSFTFQNNENVAERDGYMCMSFKREKI